MSYKYLVVVVLIFVSFNTKSDATSRDDIERIAIANGVVLTPTKSALGEISRRGFGVIPEIKRKQQLAWEEAQKKEILKQQENIKRIEAARHAQELAEFLRQKEEAAQREAVRHAQERVEILRQKEEEERRKEAQHAHEMAELHKQKEEAARQEEARHALYRAELLRKQEELIRTTALQVQEKEMLLRQQEEGRRRAEDQHVQEKLDMERKLKKALHAQEISQKKAQEIKREENVTEDVLQLRAKLAEVEQQRNELLNALTSLKGGQVHVSGGKTSYVRLGDSYIHEQNLKKPNTELDEELQRKLASIIENVTNLLDSLDSNNTLRAVQKRLTKNQLERLKEAAENFEAPVFLRTFNEVQGGLPNLANSTVFQDIEQMTQWLEEQRVALSKVGEHRIYVQRQLEVSHLVQERTAEFESFCEDYLDHVVADMCGWLTPTFSDEEGVKNAKLDFRLRLQTTSIPVLSKYLNALSPFGTNDTFLNQTFIKIGKGNDYWKFKEVLQSYSTLFRALGENVKLVEELLNYRFYQKRFSLALEGLRSIDLESIKDLEVRRVVREMVTNDVLKYNETRTTIFSASVPSALKAYMSKRAITAQESVWGREVEKLLIAYTQIDTLSNNLRIGNPKLDEFHDE